MRVIQYKQSRLFSLALNPRSSNPLEDLAWIMPFELPEDVDSFHALLKQRIRDQDIIDDHHKYAAREPRGGTKQLSGLIQVR